MCPAIPQNRQHDYSWGIISNQHLKKGQTIRGDEYELGREGSR